MPSWRSISRLRISAAWPDMNISATQVLPQSNFFSGASSASRTACRLAPQNVQNLISSLWFEAQRGHSISSSCSGIVYGYENCTTWVLILVQWTSLNHEAPAGQNYCSLPDRRADRRRWHGRGLQSLRQHTPARRRPQAAPARIRFARGPPPPLLSGSTRGI